MKAIQFTLLFVLISFAIQAQSYPVLSYRESVLGNHIYLANGAKIKAAEVEKIISAFPEDQGTFSKAKSQIRMGESLKWGGWVFFTGSILYLASGDINQQRALTSAGMFVVSLGMASIGQSMKQEGKRNASNAIEIYNFKSSRKYGYKPDLQIQVSPIALSLNLNF